MNLVKIWVVTQTTNGVCMRDSDMFTKNLVLLVSFAAWDPLSKLTEDESGRYQLSPIEREHSLVLALPSDLGMLITNIMANNEINVIQIFLFALL